MRSGLIPAYRSINSSHSRHAHIYTAFIQLSKMISLKDQKWRHGSFYNNSTLYSGRLERVSGEMKLHIYLWARGFLWQMWRIPLISPFTVSRMPYLEPQIHHIETSGINCLSPILKCIEKIPLTDCRLCVWGGFALLCHPVSVDRLCWQFYSVESSSASLSLPLVSSWCMGPVVLLFLPLPISVLFLVSISLVVFLLFLSFSLSLE